jgi:predicted secreted protein
MANTTIGWNAELWIDNDAGTPTQVAEVISISLPNPQVAEVEATHFQSPGRAREYITGLIENGEITFGINYNAGSATDTLINSALNDDQPREVMVSVPTVSGVNQEFTFPGIVKGYEKTIPIDDRQTATITIRVAGAVVQAAAS